MAKKKQPLKPGEKVMFGVVAAFVALAAVGYVVLETVRLRSDKPLFEVKTRYELDAKGERGSVVFRTARCTSCHRALRNGTNMGLSLDGIGSARSHEWILAFLKDPEATYGAKTIDHGAPPKEAAYVAQLPPEDLEALAHFLSGLKAERGSASAPVPPSGRSRFIDTMVKAWAPAEWKEKYKDVREALPEEAAQ